jgi:hypothetical protein
MGRNLFQSINVSACRVRRENSQSSPEMVIMKKEAQIRAKSTLCLNFKLSIAKKYIELNRLLPLRRPRTPRATAEPSHTHILTTRAYAP